MLNLTLKYRIFSSNKQKTTGENQNYISKIDYTRLLTDKFCATKRYNLTIQPIISTTKILNAKQLFLN